MPIQQSLKTNQQACTSHEKQHVPLTTQQLGTQPPWPQQASALVYPIRTPLLPVPQIHTDTSRTQGGEEGDWQTDVNKHAHMAGRQTGKHVLTVLNNIHTLPPTTIHSHHKPTQHIAVTTVGCVRMGWGVHSLGGRTCRVPCRSHGQGSGATQFWSLSPWFDGLDFGPGVGQLRQIHPLQGRHWLIACVSTGSD